MAKLLDCGHVPTPQAPGSCTTGYGTDSEGKRHCFACCAEQERQAMLKTGRATLYLVGDTKAHKPGDGWKCHVTDWPGMLRFRVTGLVHGSHNMTGKRIDVWFTGPEKAVWHGVQYGCNTQLVHCKRTKQKLYP